MGIKHPAQQVSHSGAERCSEKCRAPTMCTHDVSAPPQEPFVLVPDNWLMSMQQSGQLPSKNIRESRVFQEERYSFTLQPVLYRMLANSAEQDVATVR